MKQGELFNPTPATEHHPQGERDNQAWFRYRLLVTGSRNWNRPLTIRNSFQVALQLLNNPDPSQVTVVHGGAQGLDTLAAQIAQTMCFTHEAHPADWTAHGKAAGLIRNRHMVSLGADLCLAYPIGDRNQSRGTYHCLHAAHRAGIPTYIVSTEEVTPYRQ